MKRKDRASANQIVEFHRPHKIFGLRTKQELKRAERYCEFLSLVIIDVASLSKFAEKTLKVARKTEELQRNLEGMIRESVRETDVVSQFENNRLALLLSETPKEGADCVCQRLKEEIKTFASSSVKVPKEWEAPMEIVSFPDKEDGRERFLTFAQKFELG